MKKPVASKKRMYQKRKRTARRAYKKKSKYENKADVETKVKVYTSNVTAFNQQITTTGDCLRLMPQILTGTSQDARIGTEIKMSSIKLRGVLTFTLGQTTAANTRIGVRLLILKAKRFQDWNSAATDFGTNYTKLLEGSAAGFTGTVQDFNTPVNRDYFAVIADKRYYMNQSLNSASTNTLEVYNTTKFVNMTIPYSRRTVVYDDQFSAGEAVNYPYFMVLGYCKLDGSSADLPITTYLTFQYTTTAYYNDS